MSEASPVRYVTVVCRVCDTRIDERQGDSDRDIRCPMCHSAVTIPAIGSEPAPRPKSLPTGNVEGYSLLTADEAQNRQKQARAANVILVVCPICQARLHFAPKKDPYQATCPDCHEPVRVPAGREAREKQQKDKPPRKADAVEPLPVPATTSRTREYSPWYLQAQAHIRREPDAKPPRSLFFSDTFTLPWQKGVLSRWVYLSLGLTAVGLIAMVILMLREDGGAIGGFGLAFFALPILWIVLWTAAYAATVWLVILIDTANGNREIVSWGDQNWREWVIQLVYVEYLIATAAMFAYGIGFLARLAGAPLWPVFGAAVTLLFPLIALSALERGGSWNFFSKAIAGSLVRSPGLWISFFLLSAALVVPWTVAWGWLALHWMGAAAAVGGIVWAAILLIHARLLGRLAYGLSLNADAGESV